MTLKYEAVPKNLFLEQMQKKIHIVFIFFFAIVSGLFSVDVTYAQTGASLEAEIQNIEREAARQGITASQRHEALVRLARLRQLSGDIEGAARNWLEAATAIPGMVDDNALLACAYCLAAMGEWDRAITAIEPLMSKLPRARFLNYSIRAVRTGDTSSLSSIVDNPVYAGMKAEILFVLWKVSAVTASGERWRQRLLAEFPHTPEGRLAAGESSTIIVRPSPFWLFLGGLDSLPLLASETLGRPDNTPQGTVVAPPVTATPPVTVTPPAATPPSQVIRLQTGIFSRQANAQLQAESLTRAGFAPSIERRIVNNNEMWAVTVPAGTDQTHTANALRAAGFESFLVR
ncbi:MAG: SPOR domain-containing protein [Treponema sp.]|nr:SPOR domain-containing protein [Treponema sp.]